MDKYKVIELIGEGSFGRVFRATVRETGDTVALKLIPKVSHSEREITSMRSEVKIQKELSHPNIVRILDGFETEKELISVAEFIPGELYRLFDQYKIEMGYRRLPEERVQELCGDLLSALYYLHSNRILHRDIKPQNILLDNQGRAKLCDFGFARNLGMNTHVLTSIKGTPLYMAPELIEEKPYDHTADIWSLGCIVYELLCGQPPFSTTSLFKLISKIRYESIQWPSHLSEEARSFLHGVLEKESRRRLSWPDLAHHPFVQGRVLATGGQEIQPLTVTLSESQELAKEMQRQDKSKLLSGNSQTLIRVAQKHEAQKQQLAAFTRNLDMRRKPSKSGVGAHARRFSDIGQATNSTLLLGKHNPDRRLSDAVLPGNMVETQVLRPLQPLPNIVHPYLTQNEPGLLPQQHISTINTHLTSGNNLTYQHQLIAGIPETSNLQHQYYQRFQQPQEVQSRPGYYSSPNRQPYHRPPLLHNMSPAINPSYSTSGILTYPNASSQSGHTHQFTVSQGKQAVSSNPLAATAFQTAYSRPNVTASHLPPAMPASSSYLTEVYGRTNAINTQQPIYNMPAGHSVSSRPDPQTVYSNPALAAHPMYGMQAAHPVYSMPAFTSAQTVHGMQAVTSPHTIQGMQTVASPHTIQGMQTVTSPHTIQGMPTVTSPQTVYRDPSTMAAHAMPSLTTQHNPTATADYPAYGMQIVSKAQTLSEIQSAQTAYGMVSATVPHTVRNIPLAATQTVYSRPTTIAAQNTQYYPSNNKEYYLNVINQELVHAQPITSISNKMLKLKDNLKIDSKEFENMTIPSVAKLTEDLTAASVDSNVTIKNNEATDESDTDEDVDHDPESLEWIQFLDSQIEETLENASAISNLNLLEMLITPLKSKQCSSEVICKTFKLMALPFLSLAPNSKEVNTYIDLMLTCDICGVLINHLLQPDKHDADSLESSLSLLLRLVLSNTKACSETGKLVKNKELFTLLLENDSTEIQADALCLALKLLPDLPDSARPDPDILIDLINNSQSQDIIEKSILCLLQLNSQNKKTDKDEESTRISKETYIQKCLPILQKLAVK